MLYSIKAATGKEIEKFCKGLQYILMAVRWGGYESLIIPGCASISRDELDAANIDHRTMRLYVGLEEADYLIGDLERGFNKMEPQSTF